MAIAYLKVKHKLCECGHQAQYVAAGYKDLLPKEITIGYDCRCKQIPIDLEAVRATPKVIPSY
jgi:hypothetical protein